MEREVIETNGMIHGRFQPFHVGHLQHLKKALKRVPNGKKLYVGITKPFLTDNGTSVGDDHRDNKDSNPYTFEQRREMILESIRLDPEISERLEDIEVIPWPMNNDRELNLIIDTMFQNRNDVVQFMNIIPNDGWEYEKQKMLENLGFKTVNLVDIKQPRITSATEVRGLRKTPSTGDWTKKVPEGTKQVLEGLDNGTLNIPIKYKCVADFIKDQLINPKEVASATLPRDPESQGIADEVGGKLERVVNTARGDR